jgi:hypothetical protein
MVIDADHETFAELVAAPVAAVSLNQYRYHSSSPVIRGNSMRPLTKMRLMIVPMIIVAFAGVKMFLDKHVVLLPVLCIIVFIICFVLLIKWNAERLRRT